MKKLILLLLLVLTTSLSYGQYVRLVPSNISQTNLTLDVVYQGQQTQISAISIYLSYDTINYRLDSVVRCGQYENTGVFNYGVGVLSFYNYHVLGISWWSMDTLYTNNQPMVRCYFSSDKENCTYFDFKTNHVDWCELGDWDGNHIPCYFVDTLICNYMTIDTTNPYLRKDKVKPFNTYNDIKSSEIVDTDNKMIDILGREISQPKGLYIKNRRFYFK